MSYEVTARVVPLMKLGLEHVIELCKLEELFFTNVSQTLVLSEPPSSSAVIITPVTIVDTYGLVEFMDPLFLK